MSVPEIDETLRFAEIMFWIFEGLLWNFQDHSCTLLTPNSQGKCYRRVPRTNVWVLVQFGYNTANNWKITPHSNQFIRGVPGGFDLKRRCGHFGYVLLGIRLVGLHFKRIRCAGREIKMEEG